MTDHSKSWTNQGSDLKDFLGTNSFAEKRCWSGMVVFYYLDDADPKELAALCFFLQEVFDDGL